MALNWQKFDLGMQQNEALFRGSGGMVLKPEYLHKGNAPEVGITIKVFIHFPWAVSVVFCVCVCRDYFVVKLVCSCCHFDTPIPSARSYSVRLVCLSYQFGSCILYLRFHLSRFLH